MNKISIYKYIAKRSNFGHSTKYRPCQGGWMTHYFTSFSTVFQSYQDNEMLITKGCEQRNLGYGGEDFGCVYGGDSN